MLPEWTPADLPGDAKVTNMKTLLLVRHAKSSWGEPGLPDHERPLNDRGRHDAPIMGKRLAKRGVEPDVILTSTAVRARTTAGIIAGALDVEPRRIVTDDRLYAASREELLEVIFTLDDALACVMMIGHNPGLAELAHRFSEEIDDMPTCAVAEFGFDVTAWSQLDAAKAASVVFDYPKKKA